MHRGDDRAIRLVSGAAFVLAMVSLAPGVAANLGASRPDPAQVYGPQVARRTLLEVIREVLEIDCVERHGEPRCTFRASYAVRNPAGHSESVVAAFYGVYTHGVSVDLDGRPATAQLTDAEVRGLDRLVFDPHAADAGPRFLGSSDRGGSERVGFRATFAPSQVSEVVTRGDIRPGKVLEPHGYARPASETRHGWLGRDRRTETYQLEYLLFPIRTWARVGPIEIRVRYPEDWTFYGRIYATGKESPPRWATVEEDGRVEQRLATRASAGSVLSLGFGLPAPFVQLGGGTLALGGGMGDGGGLRAQLGWEVAAPNWVLYGVAVGSNLRDDLVVIPSIELASPMILVVPSFGIGVGVPVRLVPERAVGVRGQASAYFGPVGLVVTHDEYPGQSVGRLTSVFGAVGF
jgi:hypothetical protein